MIKNTFSYFPINEVIRTLDIIRDTLRSNEFEAINIFSGLDVSDIERRIVKVERMLEKHLSIKILLINAECSPDALYRSWVDFRHEFFGKILPNGVEIFSKTEGSTFYFQSPLPYLCTCTITVDAKRKDHVEERKSERQMKIETSRKFLDCTIIAYSFLRNGYNYCLANVFRKMEIAYKNGTAFREIPMKEEYGLSMLLASGFLQGCAAKHESGR